MNIFYYFTEICLGSHGIPDMLMPLSTERKVKNKVKIQSVDQKCLQFYSKEAGELSFKKLLDLFEDYKTICEEASKNAR